MGADIADMQLISKSNKGICFYYVLLMFLINLNKKIKIKIKKALQLLMLFKKYYMNLIENETKYG